MNKIFKIAYTLFLLMFASSVLAADYTLLEPSIIGKSGTVTTNFLDYANLVFKSLLTIIIALAIIYTIIGGLEYLLASTSLSKTDGKQKITDALTGLIIALLSWLVLYSINPDLVNWKLCIPKLPATTCSSGGTSSGGGVSGSF